MIWQELVENGLEYAPWLILIGACLPLIILAWGLRVFPTTNWLYLLIPTTLVSVGSVFFPWWSRVALGMDVVLLAIVSIDLLSITRSTSIQFRRICQRIASLADPHRVEIQVDNLGVRTLFLDVREDEPDGLSIDPPEHQVVVPAGKRLVLKHRIQAMRRGQYRLEKIFCRFHSRWRFWKRFRDFDLEDSIQVYPDMKQLAEYAILARTNRLSLIGVKKTRKIGQDNNFERLRDYMDGDNYRHIDWRSTARRNRLTVKQFQSDHSQRVMFLVDCGRMMTNEYRGLSLVDYALNAALMLSYVALKQRDSVGLLCFADRVRTYVPVQGGASHMNQLLHASFDQFPEFVQSRFDQAFLHFSQRCRRRSMVILVTNVIDEVSAEQVTSYLSNLSGKHLPVLALLRDHRIFDFADFPDQDDDVLYRSAAAAQILVWRNEVLKKMSRQGVLVIDAFPEQLTSSLVNKYLEAKASHLL